ncbi:amino-acid N-acetyltransferase [Nitrosomonas sp.]|uniref:amino-acid N-acetyltransferase n=1 Tax=Nitrosomonas sp. TaxID=42353 RepID=UPI001D5DA827|nr:amino-acid N-acetyltransferase [Nitrosomonas sp.]MCB1947747.1 amino-acid N-acetyltransferase [Nitrosomonas sp.]MCP5243593.1 amino-acid N-acetyltransferase [Burkholderiales bacterium]MDR4514862.1 amino-acid N-acetyltransferase [Nitrosomonas sp.]
MKIAADFVAWFRSAAPYIHTFRGKIFVIGFSGEMVTDDSFVSFIHDINLLASLGIKLVLVHGARPQIIQRLNEHQLNINSAMGIDITDTASLSLVKEAVGRTHLEIEALLSMGLSNSPMANAAIQVASGNFITACPFGVIDGVDFMHTGKVRKVNISAIETRLNQGDVVLIAPLGYSPTGEIFNLTLENVATEVASALHVEKLIFLLDSHDHNETEKPTLPRELTVAQCKLILQNTADFPEEILKLLSCAIKACEKNVMRTHLISRHTDGAILKELFTHYGIGSMVSRESLESIRKARIDDVGSILQLIEPLETEGILVRRNRELLEIEINRFIVFEHDGMIIGCAALYPFIQDRICELACLAVHPAYRNIGYGNRLLKSAEEITFSQGHDKLFVLTTHATHWFIEHGFQEGSLTELPKLKQDLYNYKRKSKVFIKPLKA